MDEGNATGAVLAGRRTVEQVDHWNGNHHVWLFHFRFYNFSLD